MSNNDLTVYDHLSYVQKLTKAPKDEKNAHQGWKYRTVDGIIEAVKSISPDGCYITMSDDTWIAGDWHYIKATATFGYKDQKVSTTGQAREPLEERTKSGALAKLPQQVTASSSTFARKIALCGLFAIDNSDAPDIDRQDQDDQHDPKKKAVPKVVYITEVQLVELYGLLMDADYPIEKLIERYNIKSPLEMTEAHFNHAKKGLLKVIEDKKTNAM